MGGAAGLLAEVCVLKGMDMCDMLMCARGESVISVYGVGVVALEGLEPESRRRDWEDGEE